MTNSIKYIFIDWNKTLSNSLFWEHLKNEYHPHSKFLPLIEKWLFKENREMIKPWMRGELSSKEISERIGHAIGLNPEIVYNELVQSCKEMRFVSERIPELVSKIRHKGIGVAIATDNMDTFRLFTVPAMKLEDVFDDLLISSELKALKEDIEDGNKLKFFDSFLRHNDINYSEAILLDDCIDKTGVYDQLGFEIIQIDKPGTLVNELEKYAA